MSILVALNIFAAVIIFVHCACKLSLRHFQWHESGLWINAMLIGGAVGSVAIGLFNQTLPEWPEILINWGLAMLFTMRTWRLWREGRLFNTTGESHARKP